MICGDKGLSADEALQLVVHSLAVAIAPWTDGPGLGVAEPLPERELALRAPSCPWPSPFAFVFEHYR